MTAPVKFLFRVLLGALTAPICVDASVSLADDGVDFFESKIRPVLVANCYKCHSAEAETSGKLKGGLRLDSREGMRRGGDSGAAVVPGKQKQSLLLSALRHEDLEMPPKGKLSDDVIADFAKWIEMGAPDPREGEIVAGDSVDLEAGRHFWSFQPVVKPQLPKSAPSGSPIDQLVAVRREQTGVTPVATAKPETLIRRLYFDLVGLPPEPEAFALWVARLKSRDDRERDAALRALVDALLESPHFGERWGRHWLDVVRYAESNGNSRNATFPHAWRYRDYVIDALNADTPYDQFLREQIAGDLLPADSPEQKNRQLVATGFLALGSKPVLRGKAGGFVPDVAADQIEVTSRAVLGLTVACARCHDHKFDPIPTADYYGLAGIFASSETLYGGGGNSMGGAPATELHTLVDDDPAKSEAYEKWRRQLADVAARQKELNAELKKLRLRNKKGQRAEEAANPVATQVAKLNLERQQLAAQQKALQAKRMEPPGSAMGIREASKVTEVPIYIRGESAKGSPIPRRLLSVVVVKPDCRFPEDQSGRRELARWLTDARNPLTARVMVNRIWLHLFGEGIVRSPDNFGFNGERPSHPELLDYLAAVFVEDDWSIKRMIRQVVLSETYRLADGYDESNYEVDPDNVYLWRHSRRRLEAEAIRDAILTANGSLDRQRPDGSVVTAHGGKLIQDSLTPDKIHQPNNHRSIYLPILRNGLPEALEVFDVADPSLVVGRRSVTTVPAQDLFLMNSPFVTEQSRVFAGRLLKESTTDSDRVSMAYRLALSRPPTGPEQERALQFIDEIGSGVSGDEPEIAAWASFCQALFVTAEFRHVR
jgi:hypothetical protein